jgi:hypothetical protein
VAHSENKEKLMAITSPEEAENRLKDIRPLTRDDLNDLIPYLGAIGGGLTWRISADLDLQTMAAIQKFDASSTKLTWAIVWLTVVAVILAAIPVIQSWCK